MLISTLPRRVLMLTALVGLLIGRISVAEAQGQTVTSVKELQALTPDEVSRNPPVEMIGLVTYSDPKWRMLFVKIEDQFLFCQYSDTSLQIGDEVRIKGSVTKGHFNPFVTPHSVEVLKRDQPLPQPVPLSSERLDPEAASGEWVRASGVVANVIVDFGWTSLNCRDAAGNLFKVHLAEESTGDAARRYLDTTIEVTGNLGIAFDSRDRVLNQMIFVDSRSGINVVANGGTPHEGNPINITQISELKEPLDSHSYVQFEALCMLTLSEEIVVLDHSGGMSIEVPGGVNVKPGMKVKFLGTRHMANGHPVIRARVLQPVGEAPLPSPISAETVSAKTDHGQRIVTLGRYPRVTSNRDLFGKRMLELTGADDSPFLVSLDVEEEELRERIEDALEIEVTGTCVFRPTEGFLNYTLHADDIDSIVVTKEKPPISAKTLVAIFGVLAALCLLGIMRSELLRRRVNERTARLTLLAAQLQASYEAVDEAILFIGRDEKVVMTNSKLQEWFGKHLVTGDSSEKILAILEQPNPKEDTEPALLDVEPLVSEEMKRLRSDPEASGEFEFELTVPSSRTLKVVSAPVRAEGMILGRLWTFRDLTNERELHAGLVQAQKMEAVGRLAGGIAHDFNNLLTGITGNLAVAKLNIDQPLESSLEHLEAAESAAVRAAELVKQMLGFSRKAILELKVCDVNEVITRLSELLRHSLGATIDVELDLDEDLPPVKLDGTRLEQVILNMCVNARDSMSDSGGSIRLKTSSCELQKGKSRPGGTFSIISIVDNGSGMTAEIQSKIFEPFFTTKEPGKGTGLGLAMSFGLVEQHGGWIDCDSEEGCGTEFRIYLPSHSGPVKRPVAPAKQQRNPITAIGTNKRILVVDDEAVVRTVAAGILKKCGFDVVTAENGREALTIARQDPDAINIVLLDLTMPVMSGKEALRQLKDLRADLPVIICSGFLVDLEAFSKEVGVAPDGFVQKPYELQDLISMVDACINQEKIALVS